MKKSIVILSAVVAIVFSSCTINKPKEDVNTVTVDGSGTVFVTANTAILSFAVVSQNWVANNLVQENTQKINAIKNALTQLAIQHTDITTTEHVLSSTGIWSGGNYIPGRYRADATVTVVVKDLAKCGAIVDAVVEAGATTITKTVYENSDIETAKRQARTLAVQDAQNAANLFAGASGCAVGNAVEIVEKPSNLAGNVTEPNGKIAITSNITIKYKLQ